MVALPATMPSLVTAFLTAVPLLCSFTCLWGLILAFRLTHSFHLFIEEVVSVYPFEVCWDS